MVSSIMFLVCLGWFLLVGGAKLKGDLSPECVAAIAKVLPEDGTVMCSDCAAVAYSSVCCSDVSLTYNYNCSLDPNVCTFQCQYTEE